MKTIGFIGGGRVTRIFLQGFRQAGIQFSEINIYDPNPAMEAPLRVVDPSIRFSSENSESASTSAIVLVAVHPSAMAEALNTLKSFLQVESFVVSLAPKFTFTKIAGMLGGHQKIARINPSASTWIGKGINPICFGKKVDDSSRQVLLDLINPLGYTPEVEEAKIEAYAMISAMGHTYFWPQIQKLHELALNFGMDSEEAVLAISKMIAGTVDTLYDSGLSYEEVCDLIPVKPLGQVEPELLNFYDQFLPPLFNKIKP